MAHDLVGDDPHLTRLRTGKEYCNCMGSCCFHDGCICEDCDCQYPTPVAVPPLVEASVSVPQSPVERPQHACQDCGTEVFRNGTRGRFPTRCPSCKEKR